MDLNNLHITEADLKDLVSSINKMVANAKPITSEPEVKILADSISPTGDRLTTFELTFWRPILPELNRHRALSQSVRSSRATPVATLIKEISNTPWGPCEWGLNEKGMVASKTINDEYALKTLKSLWANTAQAACNTAQAFANAGVHKQIVNRLLEPYSCSHAVVSATDWKHFFVLRCSPDVQPEFRKMAVKMRELYNNNTPKDLEEHQWHLPYITEDDTSKYDVTTLCKISAARCARVSYKTFDGTLDPQKDIQLFSRLISLGHYSPLEHVATPATNEYFPSNFREWNQLRKLYESN